MKQFIRKINYLDIFISSVISLIFTNKIYSFLYGKIDCSYLNDFYIGPATVDNHNKYLDFFIYFIYLILVFLIIPFVIKIKEKIKFNEFKPLQYKPFHFEKIKKFFIKYQYFGVLGYILLHPFDGSFYLPVCLLILALIVIGIFDAKKRQSSNLPSISPFCLAPFVFVLFFIPYNQVTASIDFHHFGERYATYFLTDKYNLAIYKDIMLVHGFMDILPSFLGKTLFGEFNVYGFSLGDVFVSNATALLFLILFFHVFKKAPYLILFAFVFPMNSMGVYFLIFLLLLKKELLKRPYLWLFCYITAAFLISSYRTTLGTFWVISSLPLAIFMLIKGIKEKAKYKFLYLGLIVCFAFLICYFSFDMILNYFIQAREYVKGNLSAFGNNYGFYINLFYYIISCFALFSVPFVCFELLKIKNEENKNLAYIFFLIFVLIFPFASMGYSLGRIEYETLSRIKEISYGYLTVFLPYLIYKKYKIQNKETIKNIFISFTIILAISIFLRCTFHNFINIKRPNVELNKTFKYLGKMKLDQKIEDGLIKRKNLVEKYSKNGTFLDLTNQGMNYLYFDKKMPVIFVSYFNSITTNQAKESLERLQKNPPDIILIKGNEKIYEGIYPSIRINPIYRWLLLSKMYTLIKEDKNAILVKNEKAKNFTEKELYELDKILARKDLGHLGEAWASSIKNLPVKEAKFNYTYNVAPNVVTIKFNKPINGKDIDLIYFAPIFSKEIYNKKFRIEINNSKSFLFVDSKKGEFLVPFDNFPSFLMNEKVSEIKICIKNKGNLFKSAIVKFYEKTNWFLAFLVQKWTTKSFILSWSGFGYAAKAKLR